MDLELHRLPHWARIAFAARCARLTLPIFEENWPDAGETYHTSYMTSITASERCAANAYVNQDDFPLSYVSSAVAGRALMPHFCPLYDVNVEDGPSPKNAKAATLASLAAKVAEYAERTTRSTLEKSIGNAEETFRFTINVAVDADRLDILEQLKKESEILHRYSRKEKWSDTTPVPPEVFDRDEPLHRNWWRFW
jgi:hypothetical protein